MIGHTEGFFSGNSLYLVAGLVLAVLTIFGVVAGIEMDENAPEEPGRDARERFVDDLFPSNGLPLFRVPVGANEDVDGLRQFLASHELLPARAAASEPAGMI